MFLSLSKEFIKRLLEINGHAFIQGYRPTKECLRIYLVGDLGTYFQTFSSTINPLPESWEFSWRVRWVPQCLHTPALSLTNHVSLYKLKERIWLSGFLGNKRSEGLLEPSSLDRPDPWKREVVWNSMPHGHSLCNSWECFPCPVSYPITLLLHQLPSLGGSSLWTLRTDPRKNLLCFEESPSKFWVHTWIWSNGDVNKFLKMKQGGCGLSTDSGGRR